MSVPPAPVSAPSEEPGHPAWCQREYHEDAEPYGAVCLSAPHRIPLSTPQTGHTIGSWLQFQLQQQPGDPGPTVHVQAGELAEHERVLTLAEAADAASALSAVVNAVRSAAAPPPDTPAPAYEFGVEWGVAIPSRFSAEPPVDVRDSLHDALTALSRASEPRARLVYRTGIFGTWVTADFPSTHRNGTVTLGRSPGEGVSRETGAASEPRGEEAL